MPGVLLRLILYRGTRGARGGSCHRRFDWGGQSVPCRGWVSRLTLRIIPPLHRAHNPGSVLPDDHNLANGVRETYKRKEPFLRHIS